MTDRPVKAERLSVKVRDEIAVDVVTPVNGSLSRLAVMVHGGPGGRKEGPADLFVKLGNTLADVGIASLRFDFVGVGESTGLYRDMTVRRQVEELSTVLEHVKCNMKPDKLAVIGESYGATSPLMVLDEDWTALALLWPCIYLMDYAFAPYVTTEQLREARRNGFILKEGEEVGLAFLEEVKEINRVDEKLRGSSVPTLFVHGDHDQEVPHLQSLNASELLAGPKKVVIVPGGDHCLESQDEQRVVSSEVTTWLQAYM